MGQFVKQLIIIMNKQKLLQGLIWLSLTSLSILIDAAFFHIGFNNVEHGSYTIIIFAVIILPFVFFCAYKGFRNLLEAIFY